MSVDPNGVPGSAFVQITIGQVYSEVTGMRQEVRDMAHSVQNAVGQLSDHEARIRTVERAGASAQELEEVRKDFALQLKAVRDEYGPRMSSVEKRVWMAVGASAVVVTPAAALLSQLFGKH